MPPLIVFADCPQRAMPSEFLNLRVLFFFMAQYSTSYFSNYPNTTKLYLECKEHYMYVPAAHGTALSTLTGAQNMFKCICLNLFIFSYYHYLEKYSIY